MRSRGRPHPTAREVRWRRRQLIRALDRVERKYYAKEDAEAAGARPGVSAWTDAVVAEHLAEMARDEARARLSRAIYSRVRRQWRRVDKTERWAWRQVARGLGLR